MLFHLSMRYRIAHHPLRRPLLLPSPPPPPLPLLNHAQPGLRLESLQMGPVGGCCCAATAQPRSIASPATPLLTCQYLYCCTSKASKVGTWRGGEATLASISSATLHHSHRCSPHLRPASPSPSPSPPPSVFLSRGRMVRGSQGRQLSPSSICSKREEALKLAGLAVSVRLP